MAGTRRSGVIGSLLAISMSVSESPPNRSPLSNRTERSMAPPGCRVPDIGSTVRKSEVHPDGDWTATPAGSTSP